MAKLSGLNNGNSKKQPIRVGLISLGCAKNLVDAEVMLGSLMTSGMEITNNAETADVLIVNTCSFIDAAQEESVDTILESVELRQARNRGQSLVVSGCLPQRFREELPKLLPEVDAFMGVDQVAQVSAIVQQALTHRSERLAAVPRSPGRKTDLMKSLATTSAENEESLRGTPQFGRTKKILKAAPPVPLVNVTARPTYIPDFETPRFRLTPRHFAYLKIAEGCNHPCSFCIIPRMRGSHRSRLQPDIVKEARQLVSEGVKEINLISQDSTYYGLDLRTNRSGSIAAPDKFREASKALPGNASTLCSLLTDLNNLPGDYWIRLLYTHPAHWTDELIQTIAACPKVARYIDIPLQHIHQTMLERMRRETSQQYIVGLIRKIRAGIPGIALRTTFIVGFPGETEAAFQTLLEFIRETRFERLGVFTYSQQEGTRAGNMSQQVPENVRKTRRERAMAAQRLVAEGISESFVGRTLKVLVEKPASARELAGANLRSWEHGLMRGDEVEAASRKGYMIARGEADAPDIDGRIYVQGADSLAGEFAKVKIIGHTTYDLIGALR